MIIENPQFELKLAYGKNEDGVKVFVAERDGELEDLFKLVKAITTGTLHEVIPEDQEGLSDIFKTISTAFLQALTEFSEQRYLDETDKDFRELTKTFKNLFNHD